MGHRVLVEIGVDRRFGGLFDETWAGKVGEPLAEVYRAVLVCQPAHFGED
jgi:hypothetical protein